MRNFQGIQYTPDPTPVEVNPQEVWMQLRAGPRFDQFIQLVDAMLVNARDEYVEQAASEFNRGRVKELVRMRHFLKTGETQ